MSFSHSNFVSVLMEADKSTQPGSCRIATHEIQSNEYSGIRVSLYQNVGTLFGLIFGLVLGSVNNASSRYVQYAPIVSKYKPIRRSSIQTIHSFCAAAIRSTANIGISESFLDLTLLDSVTHLIAAGDDRNLRNVRKSAGG